MFRIRLKELREAAGYKSQQAFADAFGVVQSTVGNWEAGRREPNHETTIRLADFFHVSVDYLLGQDNGGQRSNKKELPAPTDRDGLNDLEYIRSRLPLMSKEDIATLMAELPHIFMEK